MMYQGVNVEGLEAYRASDDDIVLPCKKFKDSDHVSGC
jgi:hypothetical protein